jgi:hypothetical protein
VFAAALVAGACAKRTPPPPPRDEVLLVRDSTAVEPPADREGPRRLAPADRDSLIREAETHRAAWRARGIREYRLLVAAGCFCPWPSNPAIIEVKDGVVVALRDTTGRSMGKPREPWSIYTVEGLFDAVVEHARRSADVTVRFDPRYDYPTSMRGTGRVGPPDSWFWVSAGRLTPLP